MKTFAALLLAAVATAPLATPAMAAPGHDDHGHGNAGGPGDHGGPGNRGGDNGRGGPGGGFRSFHKGDRFDSRHADHYQAIDYRHYHRLRPPPRGYRYVRSGDDVLLLTAAGVVAGITTGVF